MLFETLSYEATIITLAFVKSSAKQYSGSLSLRDHVRYSETLEILLETDG